MGLGQVRTLATSEATSFPFCSFMLLRLLGQHGGSQMAVLPHVSGEQQQCRGSTEPQIIRPIWGRKGSCGCFSEPREERKHLLPLHPRLSPTSAIWRRAMPGMGGPDSWKSVGNKKAHVPKQSWLSAQGTSLQRLVALSSANPRPKSRKSFSKDKGDHGFGTPTVSAQQFSSFPKEPGRVRSHMKLLPHNTGFQPRDPNTVLVCNRF